MRASAGAGGGDAQELEQGAQCLVMGFLKDYKKEQVNRLAQAEE
jgi:hypothetical protein